MKPYTTKHDVAFLFCFYYFPSKKDFRKENIQFSRRRFFPFLEIAHDALTFRVCRVVGVLYNTNFGCHRGSEARGGGLKSRYRPHF